eukprot:5235902-Prymnesium_polylepis.2
MELDLPSLFSDVGSLPPPPSLRSSERPSLRLRVRPFANAKKRPPPRNAGGTGRTCSTKAL